MIPIHQLLTKMLPAQWEHALGDPDFASYVGGLYKAIRSSQAKRIFLTSKDRRHFLGGFLAGLHANIPVALPPSDAPELLRDLMQPGDWLCPEDVTRAELAEVTTLDNPTIIFYTSGSTGKPKEIVKYLWQIEAEIGFLQSTWGNSSGTFLSTVPHQHFYGLLFSLLWPLCSGYRVMRQTFSHWEELLEHCSAGDYIISSPSHLHRLHAVNARPQRIFSAGAPLSFAAAQTAQQCFDLLPTEVYGSTETGGIAYRQQINPDQPLTRFANVELRAGEDQKLCVKSPYLPDDNFYQTEDRVAFVADKFHLLGRADRMVKVEGKRVCLLEIEQKLKAMEYIAEAAVLKLDATFRDELGAVVVLSKVGQEAVVTQSKIEFVKSLKQDLSLYFERVAIPRKWRFVAQLPVNAQGKSPQSLLQSCFKVVRHPEILEQQLVENTLRLQIRIPTNLSYFDGHFDGMPVVPGVVQMHWAVEYGKSLLGISGAVTLANQIKFSNLMQPQDELCLTLEYIAEKSLLVYSYKADEKLYSSGRLTIGL